MATATPDRLSIRGALPWAVLGLGLSLCAFNAALAFRGRALTAATAHDPEAAPAAAAAPPGTVHLPEPKLRAAGITTEPARLTRLPVELGVSGRLEANQDRQVQVRPRAPGVIREVKFALGQRVKKGQTLVVIDSAEVGSARLTLRAKQRELANVRTEAAWKSEVAASVASLIPELRKNTDAAVIQKQYASRPLGTFRATLLSAYSDFDVAVHEEVKTGGLRRDRIIGEHPAVVAQHARESAQAKFEAALEQAKFDANYQGLLAAQQVRLAESAVIDAAQRLRILGVSEDVADLLAHPDKASAGSTADEDVTAYPINAPFDGTVIARSSLAVPSQKAEPNEVLFTLADLSTVWVMADVPESEFALLPALQSGTIRLGATAYPGRSFGARVLSVGASVDPTTRTVPMLAQTENAEGLLKIGMFVRIVLDTAAKDEVLTVPAGAVTDHEGKPGVFVPEGGGGLTFVFRPVKFGPGSGDRRVVLSGLAAGDPVVDKGAFFLKSELTLQNDSGDD